MLFTSRVLSQTRQPRMHVLFAVCSYISMQRNNFELEGHKLFVKTEDQSESFSANTLQGH